MIKINKLIFIEILFIIGLSSFVFIISGNYDFLEKLILFTKEHEAYELDEIIVTAIFMLLCLFIFSFRRIHDLLVISRELNKKNISLKMKIEEIKQLEGIIPICSSCKKIRDDKGAWEQMESYVQRHTDASFSHGICPECFKNLYPEVYNEQKNSKEGV